MTSNARKRQFMKLFVAIIRPTELPNVSLQEGVLGLKTWSPITVILQRGEGFFRHCESSRVVPTLGKKADQRKKDPCKQYLGKRIQKQANADGQAESALSTLMFERKGKDDSSFFQGGLP